MKDYIALWKKALDANDMVQMDILFKELCAEAGVEDMAGEQAKAQADAEAAKSAAERLNAKAKDVKKV